MVTLNVSAFYPLISRRRLVLAALALVITMNLRTFTYFPGIRPVEEAWFILCIVSFVLLYPIFKIQNDWHFSLLEVYLLGVLPFLIIMPAITASREFGQPLYYGLLVRRSVALDTTWILLLNAWRQGWFSKADVEKVLVFLTWTTFTIFLLMRLILNPLNYTSAAAGFVIGAESDAPSFAEPGCFMLFGILYYALRGLRERRTKYYVYAVILYVVAVGGSGRFLTVTFAAVLGYFLFRWRPWSQVAITLAQFLAFAAVTLTIAYAVNPTNVTQRAVKFQQAFQVVTGASEVQDASATARVVETDLARPYIDAHPYFGVGVLSTQWTGSAAAVSNYFFTDDIGLVGITFSYGFLGLALLAFQYFFAMRAGASIPKSHADPLIDGAKAFVLFTAIFSITTGLFVFSFEQSSFFIVLLFLLARDYKADSVVRQTAPGVLALADFS